jgi:hypothetical protein
MQSWLFSCILFYSLIFPLTSFAYSEADKDEVVVVAEDILIKDKTLEKKLIKTLKENGTLTSTRQVDSYMLAILCEYPHKESKNKPSCNFRRVLVRPKN